MNMASGVRSVERSASFVALADPMSTMKDLIASTPVSTAPDMSAITSTSDIIKGIASVDAPQPTPTPLDPRCASGSLRWAPCISFLARPDAMSCFLMCFPPLSRPIIYASCERDTSACPIGWVAQRLCASERPGRRRAPRWPLRASMCARTQRVLGCLCSCIRPGKRGRNLRRRCGVLRSRAHVLRTLRQRADVLRWDVRCRQGSLVRDVPGGVALRRCTTPHSSIIDERSLGQHPVSERSL